MAALPPLRTTLERSCLPCIRGKRKCDRLLPACSRCTKAGRECQYTNQPVVKIQVQAPRSTELSAERPNQRSWTNDEGEHARALAILSSLTEDEKRHISERAERMQDWHRRKGKTTAPVVIPYEALGEQQKAQLERWRTLLRMKPSIKSLQLSHTSPTIEFMVNTLRLYPQIFRSTGKAPFIHPLLAGTNTCEQSSNIFHTCFSKPGPQLHHNIYSLINCRAEQGSLSSLLTAIQALLLGLMALLFADPPVLADNEARRLLHALAKWTQVLYERLPQRLPPDLEPWAAWVFAESVRRTILISHLLTAAYSLATTGTFMLSTFYTALPFDGRTGLWENVLDPGRAQLGGDGIMSYKEFTEAYKAGRKQLPGDSSSFETLVTVSCAGYEAVSEKGDLHPTEDVMVQDAELDGSGDDLNPIVH